MFTAVTTPMRSSLTITLTAGESPMKYAR